MPTTSSVSFYALQQCKGVLARMKPSVRRSNAGIVTKQQKLKQKFLHHNKGQSFQFFHRKNGSWRTTPLLYLKFWAKLTRSSKNANFQSILARSTSAVTPSKKVQLSVIRSPLPAFQRAQDEHRTLSLSYPPPQKKN